MGEPLRIKILYDHCKFLQEGKCFGCGVRLPQGQEGQWFCAAHRRRPIGSQTRTFRFGSISAGVDKWPLFAHIGRLEST
jgi:hypothetical protein